MSKTLTLDNLKQIVAQAATPFKQLAAIHGAVHWEREASFAMQALQDNQYLADVANGNPESLKRAVLNVAAVGLTLSPVHKLAYLVPRDKKVMLDISYRGLVKIATDMGVIEWAVAEVVRADDNFLYKGPDEKPTHEFQAFKERGEIVGSYVLAKRPSGGYLVTIMSIEEIYAIRDRSPAKGSGPWKTDESEMIKKTMLKRAWKMWPQTKTNDSRLDEAIELTYETDPMTFSLDVPPRNTETTDALIENIQTALSILNKKDEEYLKYCQTVTKRNLKSFNDMTEIELKQALNFLSQMVDKQMEKEDVPKEVLKNYAPKAGQDA